MRRSAVALGLILTACRVVAPTPSLTGAMGDIPAEVDAALGDLRTVLATTPDNLPRLYERLNDLRLGPTVAVLFDRAGRVDAPGHEEAVARYAEFVGQVLLASEDLDAAVAAQDLLGISIAWLRVEAEAGSLAAVLDPAACRILAPPLTSDLCRPELETGYEADLDRIIRRFLAAYRPAVRLPEAFGTTVRGQAVALVAPEVVTVLDRTGEALASLDPPPAYRGVDRTFRDVLTDLRERWAAVDTTRTDPLLWPRLSSDLAAIACAARGPYIDGRGLLLAAVPNSTVPALADLWLEDDSTGCP